MSCVCDNPKEMSLFKPNLCPNKALYWLQKGDYMHNKNAV